MGGEVGSNAAGHPRSRRGVRRTALVAAPVLVGALAAAAVVTGWPPVISGGKASRHAAAPSDVSTKVMTHHRSRSNQVATTTSTTTTSTTTTTTPTSTTTTTTTTLPPRFAPVTATATTATYRPPASSYTLTLVTTTGGCWVTVSTAGGQAVLTQTIPPGQSRSLSLTGTVTVIIGAPTVLVVNIDHEAVTLPTGFQTPFTMTLAPAAG